MIEYGGLVVPDELSEEVLSIPDELIVSRELHEESISLTPLLLDVHTESAGAKSEDVDDEDIDTEEPSRYDQIPLSTDPVRDYLRNIAVYPLLDAAKEVELAKTMEAGLYARHKLDTEEGIDSEYAEELAELARLGREARITMVVSNSRLVVSLAKRYTHSNLEFIELIQEGNIGLHRAVEKFDYVKGFKFSTYATWWIRQSITRAIADQGRTIRLPLHMVEEVNRINKVQGTMANDGNEATPEEIAAKLNMSVKRVLDVLHYKKEPVSFDWILDDKSHKSGSRADTLGVLIADKDAKPAEEVEDRLLQETVNARLRDLNEDPRNKKAFKVLVYRFGLNGDDPMTFEAIGKIFGLSRERIRQLELRGLKALAADDTLRHLYEAYAGIEENQPQS